MRNNGAPPLSVSRLSIFTLYLVTCLFISACFGGVHTPAKDGEATRDTLTLSGLTYHLFHVNVGGVYKQKGYLGQGDIDISVRGSGQQQGRNWVLVNVDFSNGDSFTYRVYQQVGEISSSIGGRLNLIFTGISSSPDPNLPSVVTLGSVVSNPEGLALDTASRQAYLSDLKSGGSQWEVGIGGPLRSGPIVITGRPNKAVPYVTAFVGCGLDARTGLSGTFEMYKGDNVTIGRVGEFSLTEIDIEQISPAGGTMKITLSRA
ncbi:MAG: hypothetical protein ACRDUS_03385 [Mycobacterium sp.]